MSRAIPACPTKVENAEPWPEDKYIKKKYTIELVTPMFGGGAKAGENDSITPIRASTICGHLRFWWRATRGTRFNNVAELRKREAEIWGDSENPSSIVVEVTLQSSSTPEPYGEYVWNLNAHSGIRKPKLNLTKKFCDYKKLPYCLFPLQGMPPKKENEEPETAPKKTINEAKFNLCLFFPKNLTDDVHVAMWAWINFGGIGARTRRGCGSLFCNEFAPPSGNLDNIKGWLLTWINKFELNVSQLCPWPVLSLTMWVGTPCTPMEAWNNVIGKFQELRQGMNVGRNSGVSGRPGRSRWPEPETIRSLTGCRLPKHAPLLGSVAGPAFPRAIFGLPIVFHFKDAPPKNEKNLTVLRASDPQDCTLYPLSANGKSTRMASPLILKPLSIRKDLAIPMIVKLCAPELPGVVLEACEKEVKFDRNSITQGIPSVMGIHDNAIDAFIAYAKTKGFKEIPYE